MSPPVHLFDEPRFGFDMGLPYLALWNADGVSERKGVIDPPGDMTIV
jgi:hypothetical protein